MMTDHEAENVERCRRINRNTAEMIAKRGVEPADIAIGNLYALFDLAERIAGPGQAAIEWLRTGVDVMESQILQGGRNVVQ